METLDNLVLQELNGGDRFEVVNPVAFQGQSDRFEIPAGFITDLASIPRLLQWFIPKLGPHNKAALLHDALWQISKAYKDGRLSDEEGDMCSWEGSPVKFPSNMLLDPVDVDGLFRRAMRTLGVSFPRRWLMWAGVRVAAIADGRIGAMGPVLWGQLVAVAASVGLPVAAIVGWLTTGFGL